MEEEQECGSGEGGEISECQGKSTELQSLHFLLVLQFQDAEIHYEEEISKFVVEKQELDWQKEALQHQNEALSKQHTEAMATFKKQFQARIFAIEEEKGKYLLAEESKEREIEGLKETLKTLQISKYTLQKKLNEMEQKLQLHMLAKEDNQKNLNEFEKCHAVLTCQYGVIKGVHERLEQDVVEAIQLNKKLAVVNKRQESEIENLKEELKKITADLIRSNVTCQHREGEENLNLTRKEQELQELQQKISMEMELNSKIAEEKEHLKEEKQYFFILNKVIIASLQHMQQLLCRQTEANVRMEMEMNELKEVYQTLERDNELQREKAKENEEKFLNLQDEYEKAQRTWKNEAIDFSNENLLQASQKKNKYTQTLEDSNNIEEEIGIKDTVTCSLDDDESNADINTGKIDLNCVEDSCCLDMNEPDMAHLCKKNQREALVGKALCTVDFITSGLPCGSCVAECEETAAKGTADKKIFDKIHATTEMKPPDSYCLVQLSVEEPEMLLERVDAVGQSNTETDHQTQFNEHVEGSVTNDLFSERNEDINDTHQEDASSSSEEERIQGRSNESKLQDNSTSEKTTNNATFCNDGSDEYSDLCKAEHTPSNQSTNHIATSSILLCKQINTSLEEIHGDNLCKNNGCCKLSKTCSTSENTPYLHASFSSNAGINTYIAKDGNVNNLPLVRNLNLNDENAFKDIHMNEMQSKQSGEDRCRLKKVNANALEGPNKSLPLHTENAYEAVDLKTNITIGVVSDKENILLKQREESLSSTVTEEMITKGNTEESYSFPINISEDLVKRSGKLTFDLPIMDKKCKKTPEYLNLPGACQAESQTVCASNSKMPFLLKEKVINSNSINVGQNMNMNADTREEMLASTSSNRVADTLNTGSINLGPKRNPSEEWNAIAKTFYDPSFPTEHMGPWRNSHVWQNFCRSSAHVASQQFGWAGESSEARPCWARRRGGVRRRLAGRRSCTSLRWRPAGGQSHAGVRRPSQSSVPGQTREPIRTATENFSTTF
ncbi:coiled-coil domain-containing protein 73 isoform X3 [Hemicordylus capensis]|uniref:coiled-coil domain-containing protein 73 isoform X3 n=1 Tax=Hemicordylus capensis TaxID=884348 RepID=UPI0023028811|nr:coiled-coil domain-containing protein 73 isoform X3 [Hemicordylus capensis]